MQATDTDDFQKQVLSRLDKLDNDIKALQLQLPQLRVVEDTVYTSPDVEDTAHVGGVIYRKVSSEGSEHTTLVARRTYRGYFKKQEISEKAAMPSVPTVLLEETSPKPPSQQQSTQVYIDINKEIRERGDRAIATAAGGAFLGGLIAQLPGAIAGGAFGAIFGLFVRTKKSSHA
ncbi:hypothetical protein [Gloeocapsopsis dulcis]|uniref:Uncharacterized protein n=1 Tax=Gloeocapsopsis dulcis AAB1 = 1H9 TaxID=1433147 RepID=A0A6N8FV87_9CHRO|nr:hypothetical protein [Gloeocapsopsis dulcis]MUL35866.1 hypothetical protein [Gloeocapsopsis dulcis AAB1 = 1H9]WNN87666.1 hypothetical protein P0S91_15230 [Gloeocapsopsis dulcis]